MFSPFFEAVRDGDVTAAVAALESGVDPDTPIGEHSWTALSYACSTGRYQYPHRAMISALLAHGAVTTGKYWNDETLLMSAARGAVHGGKSDAVEALVEYGVDVNEVSPRGFTALTCAYQETIIYQRNCPSVLKSVFEAILTADGDFDLGFNPLMWSAMYGYTKYVRVFLRHCVQIDIAYWHGRTALHLAATNGYVHAVKALLDAGAKPDLVDASGQTPLDLAKVHGHSFYSITPRAPLPMTHNETVEILSSVAG